MSESEIKTDIAIVGGGLTGLALALSLRDLPCQIVLLDKAFSELRSAPHFDDRALAISEGSKRLMQQLDIWDTLKSEASPIRHIHISDRGHFGKCDLRAADHHVEAFGHVIELRMLGSALWQAIQSQKNLTFLQGQSIQSPQDNGERVTLVTEKKQIDTSLVLAADGGPSALRKWLQIDSERIDYQQTALIANVQTECAHDGRAYERFTEYGPIALLPLTRERLSLVWTMLPEQATKLCDLAEKDFLTKLQSAFGWRLGAFTRVGERASFPLHAIHAIRRRQARTLLMGNAAHTLHPVAGQGFNLALRDLMAFAEHCHSFTHVESALENQALDTFLRQRQADAHHVKTITHGLINLFANDHAVLSSVRGLSLSTLDSSPSLKRFVATQAMGFRI